MAFTIVLRYKGCSLKIDLPRGNFYAKTRIFHGKTVYEALFEHFVTGEPVSMRGFARECGQAAVRVMGYPIDTKGDSIGKFMARIEAAARKSGNPALRKKSFVRLPRGGASPVLVRKSPDARFTPAARKIMLGKIRQMHRGGSRPTSAQIRDACLQELRAARMAENMVVSDTAIVRMKIELGLRQARKPLQKPPIRRRL